MSDPLMMCLACGWVGRDTTEAPEPAAGLTHWRCPACGDTNCIDAPPKLDFAFAVLEEVEAEAQSPFADTWATARDWAIQLLARARAAIADPEEESVEALREKTAKQHGQLMAMVSLLFSLADSVPMITDPEGVRLREKVMRNAQPIIDAVVEEEERRDVAFAAEEG